MAVTAVTVDPDDVTDVSFDAAAWCTAESTSLASYTVASSATVTVVSDADTGNVVTARITATAPGSVTCHMVFADGQERERTITVRVTEL